MNRSTVVVHAGPTVTADEVHTVLPDAVVRTPVARGDLLAGTWRPGDTAVLVDGFFRERRSVGHKEILWLLGAGVDVIGTASMGALRAAELSPYGMRGLGEVHAMYARGEIDGDDEVGVVHGPAVKGYPAQTVALVNLRYGCREGVRRGLFPAGSGHRIVEAARRRPFTHRSWPELRQAVGAEDQAALELLNRMIGTGEWDRKRLDAMAALRAVAAGDLPPAPVTTGVTTGISRDQVLSRSSRHEYAPGRWMSDLDVLDAARLFDENYPDLHAQVLTGLLAELAAAEELSPDAFVMARLGTVADPLPARLAAWLTPAELTGRPDTERLRQIMVRVWPSWQSADWRPAVLARLRASQRWAEWSQIVSRADEVAEETRYRMVTPPPALCARIFLRHWQRGGATPRVEMARRGFTGEEDLGAAVRRFFAYDVQRTRAQAATR